MRRKKEYLLLHLVLVSCAFPTLAILNIFSQHFSLNMCFLSSFVVVINFRVAKFCMFPLLILDIYLKLCTSVSYFHYFKKYLIFSSLLPLQYCFIDFFFQYLIRDFIFIIYSIHYQNVQSFI